MAFNFNRRINPVIPTTAVQTRVSDVLLVTAPFTPELVTPKFIIQIDQSIPFGNTMPVVMSDVDGANVSLFDKYGNYVRADRLYRAMSMRRAGCLPYAGWCPNEFQCVVGFDPVRVTVLSDLPLSVYCPPTPTPTPTPPDDNSLVNGSEVAAPVTFSKLNNRKTDGTESK